MSVAFFDLDDTLLAGDSDHLWGQYLISEGAVPAASFKAENDRFLQDYRNGTLDHEAFLAFQLRPLSIYPVQRLEAWRAAFTDQWIRPLVLPKAVALLDQHRARGHECVIVTATNDFITRPIANLLGVKTLLATRPEQVNGRYTGKVSGPASFGPGKVVHAKAWLERHGRNFTDTWFYTDSCNDLPLLEQVSHPVAVDADSRLEEIAVARGWERLSLRG